MATGEFNNFNKIAQALTPACGQVVRKTALDCKANIQARIRSNGQIETSFMINSVYTVTSQSSDYRGGENALPEVPRPTTETEAFVAVAAYYGMYQNYGTRYQPGRAFFEPGVEATRSGFDAATAAIQRAIEEAAQ